MFQTLKNKFRELAQQRRGQSANMENIFNALIVLVVGLALLPVVRSFVDSVINDSSTGEQALLGLITLLWVIVLVAVVISVARGSLRGRR